MIEQRVSKAVSGCKTVTLFSERTDSVCFMTPGPAPIKVVF